VPGAAARRLPGVRFEVWAPPLPAVLPRMDVAAFVGFAAAGPLHQPVALEDVGHLDDLFGRDVSLAWDADRGEVVRAHLAPAVRAFFANGGARCVVVRVAGAARANRFPLPGMLAVEGGALRPAFGRARSEGSWSDALGVGATVAAQPLQLAGLDGGRLALLLDAGEAVAVGDLLRVTFDGARLQLVVPVRDVAPPPGATPARAASIDLAGALWLDVGLALDGPARPSAARWFAPEGAERALAVLASGAGDAPGSARVTLGVPLAAAPPPGTLLRLEGAAAGEAWLAVGAVEAAAPPASPRDAVDVTGRALRVRPAPDPLPSTAGARGEQLALELWIRRGGEVPVRLAGLGFCPAHARAWQALPADDALFDEAGAPLEPSPDDAQAALRDEVRYPRFPLAGPGAAAAPPAGAFTFPVGDAFLDPEYLGCGASADDALLRDGLAAFDEAPFLDPDLAEVGTDALLGEAEFIRQQSPSPRRLRGLHALLPCEEVTLAAVPDAIHRGWMPAGAPTVASPAPPGAAAPPPTGFRACGAAPPPAPAFLEAGPADAAGSFAVAWTPLAGASFTLDEATRPGFEDAYGLYEGGADRVDVRGRSPGTYSYRVRASLGASQGPWSAGASVTVAPPLRYVLTPATPSSPAPLLAVQRSLLRLCAARGDVLAALSLPEAHGPDDAIAHAALLQAPPTGDAGVQALSFGEQHDLSFGALYHPWLVRVEAAAPADLRREPPDGAVCGVMARRALERGAWVAPANEPLAGVVDLSPAIGPARWADLQDAQVNVVRQEPRGFVALAADTLALEPDFVPIPARRLLALVRRAALRLGPDYVFEPDDDALRRMVQRGFEELLGELYARGAFAGASAASAFQVVAGSPEAPGAADQGLFFVELRVAPSLPMRFVTVRLVQGGDGAAVTEVR
jgi:hypothetical protein